MVSLTSFIILFEDRCNICIFKTSCVFKTWPCIVKWILLRLKSSQSQKPWAFWRLQGQREPVCLLVSAWWWRQNVAVIPDSFFLVRLLFFLLDKELITPPRPQTCNFIKKETLAQVFSCESCDISKKTSGRLLLHINDLVKFLALLNNKYDVICITKTRLSHKNQKTKIPKIKKQPKLSCQIITLNELQLNHQQVEPWYM